MAKPLDVSIIAPGPDQFEDVIALDNACWYTDPAAQTPAMAEGLVDLPRMRVAVRTDDGTWAGLLGGLHVDLTVPGPADALTQAPSYGLSWAGMKADARRRGVFRQLMLTQLRAGLAEGRATAALFASEPGIYSRFGFAPATWEARLSLSAGQSFDAAPSAVREAAEALDVRIHRLDSEAARTAWDELVPRWAAGQLGACVTAPERMTAERRDNPDDRRGREPGQAVVVRRAGAVTGFAEAHREHKWENGMPQGTASAVLFALDDAALLALAQAVTSFDLIATTKVHKVPERSALTAWAGGPRAIGLPGASDGLWVRVLDVPRALTERGYCAPGAWVVEVTDPVLPEVADRYRLVIGDDLAATCERSDDGEPDVTVPVQVLGQVYLGQRSLTEAARESYPGGSGGTRLEVTEHRPEALRELSRAFAREERATSGLSF